MWRGECVLRVAYCVFAVVLLCPSVMSGGYSEASTFRAMAMSLCNSL
jgi:hypothetical protein